MTNSTEDLRQQLFKLKANGYRVVLYRNHCLQSELISFVNAIGAKHTVLLRPQLPSSVSPDTKTGLNFWAHKHHFIEDMNMIAMYKKLYDNPMEVSGSDAEITPHDSIDCVGVVNSWE